MPIFLAIDAGGTSTRALLADSDRILARASTGSVKLMRVGEAEATTRLHALIDQLASAAGAAPSRIARVCFGLAGVTIPAVRAWAAQAIAARTDAPLLLLGDEQIALDAAFHFGPGILIIAGTGSNAVGRDAAGRLHSAGGHGPILGDEGAGFWIGLEAIRRALRARDAEPDLSSGSAAEASASPPDEPSTHLLHTIFQAWNLPSLPDLIELGNHRGDASRPAPDFASLVPAVAAAAQQGNPIAVALLAEAGGHLGSLVLTVARKMHPRPAGSSADPSDLSLDVAFTGSVLTHVHAVRESMVARIAHELPAARVHSTPADPLDGALFRARHG